MKVLYYHQHFTTDKGKSGTRSYEFAKYLVSMNHQVLVVCGASSRGDAGFDQPFINGQRHGFVEGIEVIQFNLQYSNNQSFIKRSIVFMNFALKSIKIALTKDYDVLFATSTPLTAGIPGIIAKLFRPRKRFVFEVRDLWPELPKAMGVIKNPVVLWLLKLLEKLTYRMADGIVALSPGIEEGIRITSPKKDIVMIPNSCDLELFKPESDKGKIKEEYGFSDKDFVCVFTGAHGIANGLDAVLDAAKSVQESGNSNIKFLFIGEGNMKKHLLSRVKEENISNCLFFTSIPKVELARLLSSLDLGMMILANIPAFYFGTSPNKFFDYIACGLPVINNYPGWLAGLINENDSGIVVPPEDPLAFSNAVISLYRDKNRVKTMGQNARTLAEKSFGRKKLANDFNIFIQKQISD